MLLPVVLMVLAVKFLQHFSDNKHVVCIFRVLRMAVVGLIAAAALQLLSVESFGQPGLNLQFMVSVVIFGAVFSLSLKKKSPIVLILCSGVIGLLLYGLV